MKGLWFFFVILAGMIVAFVFSLKMRKTTKVEGVETIATVTRVEEGGDVRTGGIRAFAKYRTDEGEEVEGILLNPQNDPIPGQRVRVWYHPAYRQNLKVIEVVLDKYPM